MEPQLKVYHKCCFLPKDLIINLENLLKIIPIEAVASPEKNRHHGHCEFCRKDFEEFKHIIYHSIEIRMQFYQEA